MGQTKQEYTNEVQNSKAVTVSVVHAIYNCSIDVRVSESATLLDVRKAVAAAEGFRQVEDVLLVEKIANNFGQLLDGDLLQNRRELLALGGSIDAANQNTEDHSSAPAMSTLALIKEGRAVGYSPGRPVVDGEIIRIEAEGWKSSTSFSIELLNDRGDVVLHWQVDATNRLVVRTSCINGSWGHPPVKETAGKWPFGNPKQPVCIDFERSSLKWKVHVNGIRLPRFDFAHRVLDDVTQVKISENLTDAKAILILRSDSDVICPPPVAFKDFLQNVSVTHAVYGRSIEVLVSTCATMLDIRKRVLKKTGASRIEEVLLVQRVGRFFGKLPDDKLLKGSRELLALGCNSAFVLGVDANKKNLPNLPKPSSTDSKKLCECIRAVDFPSGHEVCVGDTIRVQAEGWSGPVADSRYSANTFYINLLSDYGDIVLHWGARLEENCVVRNSRIDDEWGRGFGPVEESVGGWPHGNSKDPLVIDFTRAAFNWMIHVNGVRLPDFDFAHRMPDDVSNVQVSDNLLNAKVVLIPCADTSEVTSNTFICVPTRGMANNLRGEFEQDAREFKRAQPVRTGDIVRVEAQWWDKGYSQAAQTHNAFFIDLKSKSGDIALHWGARPQHKIVVRSSMLDGFWGAEERRGGWPHLQQTGGFFGDNIFVDFQRTDLKWLVSVNGQRQPSFDYKHRTQADVTCVAVSNSLCNVEVTLIEPEETLQLKAAEAHAGKSISMLPRLLGNVGAGSSSITRDAKFAKPMLESNETEFVKTINKSPAANTAAQVQFGTLGFTWSALEAD